MAVTKIAETWNLPESFFLYKYLRVKSIKCRSVFTKKMNQKEGKVLIFKYGFIFFYQFVSWSDIFVLLQSFLMNKTSGIVKTV